MCKSFEELAMRHIKKALNLAIGLSILAGLVSCGGGSDSSTGPAKTGVTGTWIGSVGTQTLSMALVENSGVVSGSGSLTGVGGPFAQTITGAFTAPTLTITLTSGQHPPFTLTATLSGTALTGSLNGSGFTGDAITLNNASVGAGVLSRVDLSGSASIENDVGVTFTAVTRDKFGNLVSAPVTWTSSAPTFASVAPSSVAGVATVTALAVGTSTITATATVGSATASANQAVTVTPSLWVGTWTLISVNNLVPPASFSDVGFATRVVARTLTAQAGHAGTWADSSTSQFACNPPTLSGAQCNAGGRANITWSVSAGGSVLTVAPVAGTIVGTVTGKTLFRQANGTATAFQGTQSEIYRKQ